MVVACFTLSSFAVFLSYSSMVMTLSSLLSSSALLVFSPSSAHSVMEEARIYRSWPASDSPWRIAASVRNGGKSTAFRGVQSLCFFDRARLPVAARRRTSMIVRRILLLSMAKEISILREITESDIRSPARAKTTTYSPRDLFSMSAWPNFNRISPGMALLVSIATLRKSS